MTPESSEGWIADEAQFGEGYRSLLLEQYKLYVDSAEHISDRRGAAHTLLLTVNTSLITVYGLVLGKDVPLATVEGPWTWIVPLVGILVSLAWYLLIRSYRTLNDAKFKVIHGIEQHLPIRLFWREWQILEQGRGWAHIPLTHIERWIPGVFGLFYLVLLLRAGYGQ